MKCTVMKQAKSQSLLYEQMIPLSPGKILNISTWTSSEISIKSDQLRI